MKRKLAQIAILVNDYDEAIEFYVNKLNFILVEDSKLSETKRWVLLSPSASEGCMILLAKASDDKQLLSVGNQAGGRVFLFLYTNDFENDFENFLDNGVEFTRLPVREPWGMVAVFKDLYGNLWDLIEHKTGK